ncbi:hypothetical protein VNO77_43034 [Canavalia gladiata]|uniref:DUF4220 domain-containing protein n=1 Tax=Canavalia gladiata TaxID=3824 RepID=A0AAN9PP32_CANGL
MLNLIPEFVRNIWSKWDIRCVVLTSLLLQITLNFLTPFRKRTRNSMVILSVWFSYLFADYTANFGVGLISDKYGDEDTSNSNNGFLIAFWAPFLLLHLGGPDTITAFSLEDNELWLRHMLGLVVQVCLTAYVFLLTLPANTFWLPTTFVFLAGIIKFSERTRSLQLASFSNSQQSFKSVGELYQKYLVLCTKKLNKEFPPGRDEECDNSSKAMHEQAQMDKHKKERLDDVSVVTLAFLLFHVYKMVFVETKVRYTKRFVNEYFDNLTAIDALRVVEVELNFIYEALYTKASLVHNKVGFFFRFVSITCVVVALILFAFDQKHGCNEFDVRVTYILLYGAVALDVVSFFILIFSDHTFACLNITILDDSYQNGNFRWIRNLYTFIFRCFLKLRRPKCCPRWPESISGFNFISYCLHKRKGWIERTINCIGAGELEQWALEEKNALCQELWIFIFKEFQRKRMEMKDELFDNDKILNYRGEWIIRKDEILQKDQEKWMKFVDIKTVSFEQNIIQWHIATTFLFYGDDDVDVKPRSGSVDHETNEDVKLHRDFSKLLSDYMLYLLVMNPTMMSNFKEIGFEERWENYCYYTTDLFQREIDTKADNKILPPIKKIGESIEKFFTIGKSSSEDATKNTKKLREACDIFYNSISDPSQDITRDNLQVFNHAVTLTEMLKELEGTHKWKIIAQVWVEMLSYAASNCRSLNHAQQLGKGRDFISLVWLLMSKFGLGKRFTV